MSVPRFWREIPQRYTLLASKCTVCQGMHFPPREVCPTCRRLSLGKIERVRLAGVGTILEFTKVHRPAPGYQHEVPYILALVRSAEGPILTGQVVDSREDDVQVGASVKALFRRLGQDGESGVIYYGTKWQVAPTTTGPADSEDEDDKP